MATSALDVTPEEMAEYRATMRRHAAEDEARRVAMQERAWVVARAAAARLRERYEPSRVLLYGSLARGEMRRGSDIDIAAWGIDASEWLNVVGVGLKIGGEFETNICLAESRRPEVRDAALHDGIDLCPLRTR